MVFDNGRELPMGILVDSTTVATMSTFIDAFPNVRSVSEALDLSGGIDAEIQISRSY